MPTATLQGFDCFYERHGSGRPLLLLHGGMGIGADWQLVLPDGVEGYELIVPDLRGHGRSTNPGGAFTFRQCAADVLALLDHLEIATASALGLSMGAKTLLHVATRQPDRLDAMVLVSATPRFPDSVRPLMRQYSAAAFDALPESERQALRARHRQGDAQIRALFTMMGGFADSDDDLAFTAESLATIRARTLIVHGDRDPLYPIEMAVELYRGIPGAALWVVPHGGHGPIFGPLADPFVRQVTPFLQSR